MNLQLAITLSCTKSGCRVQYLDSDVQTDAHYSQPMLDYGIVANPGDLLVIDTDATLPRIVFRWVLVEVKGVADNSIFFEDASGNLRSLSLAEGIEMALTAGDNMFTDGREVVDIAVNGNPAHPARLSADFFPKIQAMYQPLDSPYLRLIDTNTPGRRNDVTPVFADYGAFSALVEDLSECFKDVDFDYVAGIDALGFILGTAMAFHFEVGFLPIRKGGKLPVPADKAEFVDYSNQSKSLELRENAIEAGAKVLLVDEWIETGAQIKAAIELLENQGGTVVGIATINIDDNEGTHPIKAKYNCHAVWGGG